MNILIKHGNGLLSNTHTQVQCLNQYNNTLFHLPRRPSSPLQSGSVRDRTCSKYRWTSGWSSPSASSCEMPIVTELNTTKRSIPVNNYSSLFILQPEDHRPMWYIQYIIYRTWRNNEMILSVSVLISFILPKENTPDGLQPLKLEGP